MVLFLTMLIQLKKRVFGGGFYTVYLTTHIMVAMGLVVLPEAVLVVAVAASAVAVAASAAAVSPEAGRDIF